MTPCNHGNCRAPALWWDDYGDGPLCPVHAADVAAITPLLPIEAVTPAEPVRRAS